MSDMDQQPSEYLQYLPPFFREGAGDGTATGEFLPNLLLEAAWNRERNEFSGERGGPGMLQGWP